MRKDQISTIVQFVIVGVIMAGLVMLTIMSISDGWLETPVSKLETWQFILIHWIFG